MNHSSLTESRDEICVCVIEHKTSHLEDVNHLDIMLQINIVLIEDELPRVEA
jgi:hypothetical protein